MSNVKTSMVAWKQPLNALLVAALVMGLFGTILMTRSVSAAPASQTIQSQEVAGTLTGGQSTQIWLGLTTQNPSEDIRVLLSFGRERPTSNGLGFYVLTAEQTRAAVSGAGFQNNNLAAGAPFTDAPDNQIDATFGTSGCPCTLILFNNSTADVSFVASVENGLLVDDAGQVRDNLSPAADEEEVMADEGEEAVEEAEAPAAATPAPVVTSTETTATETTADATTEAETTEAAEGETVQMAPSGEVRANVMQGELPEQFDQHYLALEPDGSDVTVRIVMAFDPQDRSELARRMNFWVMDDAGFRRYTDPTSGTPPGSIAFAAGSTSTSLRENERVAEFRAPGAGNVVVIVYNNSEVPASYEIRSEGGIFIDDSMQTLTAQQSGTTTTTTTTATTETEDADTPATTATTTTPATTTSTRTGEPGGSYVVQSGDTLSLIARDVLGDIDAWRDICNLNELADCNRIEVGTELLLPTTAQIGATTAPATTSTTATATTTAAAADDEDADEEDAAADDEEVADMDDADEEDAADDAAESSVDLVAALRAAGGFDTLVTALEAANLTDSLVTGGPFTIFAPTDAAFDALPAGAMEQLLNQPTGQLTQILLFHVLPGRVGSDDVTDGMQATTQQGRSVRFELSGGDVLVNGANVVVPDIAASNGVIHAIDAVILPPTD